MSTQPHLVPRPRSVATLRLACTVPVFRPDDDL